MSRIRKPELDNFNLGINVLQYLVHQHVSRGVSQVAAELGLARSRAYDLLQLLCSLGFVLQNTQTRRYRASPQFFALASKFHDFGIAPKVREFIRQRSIEGKCSIFLSVLWQHETYVICSTGIYGDAISFASHGPACLTAAGKAIISHMPETFWAEYQPSTSAQRKAYFSELRVAARDGVAWNEGIAGPHDLHSVAAFLGTVGEFRYSVAIVLPVDEWRLLDPQELSRRARELRDGLRLFLKFDSGHEIH